MRKLRKERHMSQEQLALAADITTVYISEIERGLKNPTIVTIEMICEAMSITLADFFAYADKIKEPKEVSDAYLSQIMRILESKTEQEKKIYLQILKQVDKLQSLSIE